MKTNLALLNLYLYLSLYDLFIVTVAMLSDWQDHQILF
jgi:hypothetical protein